MDEMYFTTKKEILFADLDPKGHLSDAGHAARHRELLRFVQGLRGHYPHPGHIPAPQGKVIAMSGEAVRHQRGQGSCQRGHERVSSPWTSARPSARSWEARWPSPPTRRTSADMIKSAVCRRSDGQRGQVLDLGMLPTPALQYYVKNSGVKGGVMITASHNPPEFNGIKCVDYDGTEMPREKEEMIEAIYFNKSFVHKNWKYGRVDRSDRAVSARPTPPRSSSWWTSRPSRTPS